MNPKNQNGKKGKNIKKKEKAGYDGRWMVDGGGWWMVEKKVLRFLSNLEHFYFKINRVPPAGNFNKNSRYF